MKLLCIILLLIAIQAESQPGKAIVQKMNMGIQYIEKDSMYCNQGSQVVWAFYGDGFYDTLALVFYDTINLIPFEKYIELSSFECDKCTKDQKKEYEKLKKLVRDKNQYGESNNTNRYMLMRDRWDDWYTVRLICDGGVMLFINSLYRQNTHMFIFPVTQNLCD